MDRISNILFPSVPVVDTSVQSMLEQGTPVAPVESQYFDTETPLHIFKSFDFKNMPKDPHAIKQAQKYVPPAPSEPIPQANVINQPSA